MNKARRREFPRRFEIFVKYIRCRSGGIHRVKVYHFVQGAGTLQGKRGGWKLWGVFSKKEWEGEVIRTTYRRGFDKAQPPSDATNDKTLSEAFEPQAIARQGSKGRRSIATPQ